MLNLIQLNYFCALYQARNYSKAAEKLFLTRQALKKSISALEEEVGGQLFTNQRSALFPTALADYFYPEAQRLIDAERLISQNLQEFAEKQTYTIHVGATFSALETVAPTLPLDFQSKHPTISLDILTIPDGVLEHMVDKGELDCAFVIGKPQKLYSKLLGSQPLYFIMRPELRPTGEYISVLQLASIPLLLVNSKFKARHQLMNKFGEQGVNPNIRFESSDFSLLMSLCERGEGAVPIPESRLGTVNNNELVAVQVLPEDDPRWNVYYIRKEMKEVPYALRLLEDMLPEPKI